MADKEVLERILSMLPEEFQDIFMKDGMIDIDDEITFL